MPFYDYHCEANGKTVEVFHKMNHHVKTWGEICEMTGIEPDDTPADAPVVRMIAGKPTVWKLKGLDKDAPSKKLEL